MRTSVDTRSEAFQANKEAMLESLAEIEELTATVVGGGGSSNPEKATKAVARHREPEFELGVVPTDLRPVGIKVSGDPVEPHPKVV